MPLLDIIVKVGVSAGLITLVSELAKRSTWIAAIVASLPLTTVLSLIWVYRDSHDVRKVSALSVGVFWMVLPSLGFLLLIPVLLKAGMRFGYSMLIASSMMVPIYWGYVYFLRKVGIEL